jgi:hypothetical protein
MSFKETHLILCQMKLVFVVVVFFQTGSPNVAKAGLKLVILLHQLAGITGSHHCS